MKESTIESNLNIIIKSVTIKNIPAVITFNKNTHDKQTIVSYLNLTAKQVYYKNTPVGIETYEKSMCIIYVYENNTKIFMEARKIKNKL